MKKYKKIIYIICIIVLFTNCGKENNDSDSNNINFRQEMRNFVINISQYARSQKPGFIIIPQNGHKLITENGENNSNIALNYLHAINGIGREDLFYGYNNDNEPTPDIEKNDMIFFMDLAESYGIEVLATDYCSSESYINNSYQQNNVKGYISFAANSRELDTIPLYPAHPYNENDSNVTSLPAAQNFLYLINNSNFESDTDFIEQVKQTNFDCIIMDLFWNETNTFTQNDIQSLKTKNNGASRLIIAYMSIGEAEKYRYYWQDAWNNDPPEWLEKENPDWPGNYKVKYWKTDWQNIIYNNNQSYLKKIIDAGFDGVYLDIIDAYEYFEK